MTEIHGKGVGLYLHKQGLDSTTSNGRAMFGMLSVFAEFEREIIQERIHAGLARAKKHGTKSGRPLGRPKISDAKRRKILAARRQGKGFNKIAREIGVGVGTVCRVIDEAESK